MSDDARLNDPRFRDSRGNLRDTHGDGSPIIAVIILVILLAAGYFVVRAYWAPTADNTSTQIAPPASSVPAPITTAPDVVPPAPDSMAPASPAAPPAATPAPLTEPNTTQ